MKQGKLFVLSGPSGVGKGTICNEVMKHRDFYFSVSMTTRKPREGEIDGVHYRFVSKEEFEDCISRGGLLEYASAYDNYYGTPKEPVLENLAEGKDMLLDIEMQGALQVKKSYPEAVLIFILPPSRAALIERLKGRGSETEESLKKRTGQFLIELEYLKEYDYYIINDDIDRAVTDCLSIIDASHGQGSADGFNVPADTDAVISKYTKGE